MTEPLFVEIVFSSADFQFGGRDEVEDPLHEALARAGVGEVTGRGSGMGKSNIDVELYDLERGLAILRHTLKALEVAPSTTIRTFQNGTSTSWPLDEPSSQALD